MIHLIKSMTSDESIVLDDLIDMRIVFLNGPIYKVTLKTPEKIFTFDTTKITHYEKFLNFLDSLDFKAYRVMNIQELEKEYSFFKWEE